jgi:hypothetical protein
LPFTGGLTRNHCSRCQLQRKQQAGTGSADIHEMGNWDCFGNARRVLDRASAEDRRSGTAASQK